MLPSATPAVLEDTDLEDFIQGWVVQLTGLSGQMVRPRWQPEPANIPNYGENWCGIGIARQEADTFATEIQKDQLTTEMRRHETLECLASFYGPNAGKYAAIMRDGMQLGINREYLDSASMGLVDSGELLVVPELVKERWMRRVDISFTLKRQIVRDYSVPSILRADGVLHNEKYDTNILVK